MRLPVRCADVSAATAVDVIGYRANGDAMSQGKGRQTGDLPGATFLAFRHRMRFSDRPARARIASGSFIRFCSLFVGWFVREHRSLLTRRR